VVNEAALAAARDGRDRVTQSDLESAYDKVILGARRRFALSDEDKRRVAVHEGGHALVAYFLRGSRPVGEGHHRPPRARPGGHAVLGGRSFQPPRALRASAACCSAWWPGGRAADAWRGELRSGKRPGGCNRLCAPHGRALGHGRQARAGWSPRVFSAVCSASFNMRRTSRSARSASAGAGAGQAELCRGRGTVAREGNLGGARLACRSPRRAGNGRQVRGRRYRCAG